MDKISELSLMVTELKRCTEALVGISELLSGLVKDTATAETSEQPQVETLASEEKPITLEQVRAVLAEKSQNGFTAEIRELLTKHGAKRLSDIEPGEYAALLAEAEGLQ